MNPNCLQHTLTPQEQQEFEAQGYIIIDNALSSSELAHFTHIVDEIDVRRRAEDGLAPHERVNLHDTIGQDERLLDLIDWPTIFPKVWGILGWAIQLYHTQLIITLPASAEAPRAKRLGWHQDNNRMSKDLAVPLQPRVSLKVAYFLSDTTRVGNGNFYIVPGSHQGNRLSWSMNDKEEPQDALPLCVKAGTAVIFDRRLYHAGSPNYLDTPRKVLFYGYSHRWLRPKCHMNIAHLMDQVDPIRRQLLGYATSGNGYYDPQPADVPLRDWLQEHVGDDAVAPWVHTDAERRGLVAVV